FTRPIALNTGGGGFDTNGFNILTSGVISGAGKLTKFGNGILTLGTASTYSGGTTVSGGTLAVGSDGQIGATADLTLNGGALRAINPVSNPSRNIVIGANGGTFDSTTWNHSLGTVTGTGTLHVTGGAGGNLVTLNYRSAGLDIVS